MKQGDFTTLAKSYINRPSYSKLLLNNLLKIIDYDKNNKDFKVVEVGAGTGKLTKILSLMGLNIIAIEPNDAMRAEGIAYTRECSNIEWRSGSGEDTMLEPHCANWVIMASSFHWTNHKKSLPEFSRILKDNGYFTAMWNPRNIQISPLHLEIENSIKSMLPNLNRVSSGSQNTKEWESVLVSTGDFKDCIFMQTDYLEHMSKQRYMGAWSSVNDIQAQAGEERFEEILSMIEGKIKDLDIIEVPYKIKAWSVKKA